MKRYQNRQGTVEDILLGSWTDPETHSDSSLSIIYSMENKSRNTTEHVLDYLDKFCQDLQRKYEDLLEKYEELEQEIAEVKCATNKSSALKNP